MTYGDKEKVYDEKISPLMTEIIKICKSEGINMATSFQLPSEQETNDGNHFLCTTLLPLNKEHYPQQYEQLCRSIYQKPFALAITITKGSEQP
jgi:hypothetical protein